MWPQATLVYEHAMSNDAKIKQIVYTKIHQSSK